MIEVGDLVTVKTDCIGVNFSGRWNWLGLVIEIMTTPFDTDGEYSERIISVQWCGNRTDEDFTQTFESSLEVVSKAKKKLDKWEQIELELS